MNNPLNHSIIAQFMGHKIKIQNFDSTPRYYNNIMDITDLYNEMNWELLMVIINKIEGLYF